ncbi:FG-GAP-like repeat-containing protein [Streptomyces sp. NPDC057682]|uniref:FG-GAP-like repeat-containing protein n=1 Tax=Streptomyces sp. NPDC057682 TaxID=3346210 RepID=UPI0036C8DB9C
MTRSSSGWRRRRASGHLALLITLAITGGAGAAGTGTAAADTGTAVAGASAADTVVVSPGARFVPRTTRILNAGETGFLTAQEGDDRLRWIDYATGTATVLSERLPKPLAYNPEEGREVGAWPTGFGQGSDTVAVYAATPDPHVTLQQGAGGGATTVVPIPEGQTYVQTFGTTVVTRTGAANAVTSLHLLRRTADGIEDQRLEGLPEGWNLGLQEGDGRSALVRGILWEDTTMKNGWWLVDLATGAIRTLDAHAESVSLTPDSVLQIGSYGGEVLDRNDPTAPPRPLDLRNFAYDTTFRMLGDSLVAVDRANAGNNEYRGNSLALVAGDYWGEELLAVAHTDLTRTPDGSLLVAGAEKRTDYGALDWGYYRFTAGADGKVTRTRVADIEDMPARPAGIALGSGILTTADDSYLYQPHTYVGGYRSTWLKTSGRPEEIRTTQDGLIGGRDADCGWTDAIYCVTMFASGDGFHGRKDATEQDVTMLYRNGEQKWGPQLTTGLSSPELVDLSGRYGVIGQGTGGTQRIAEFKGSDPGTVVETGKQSAALWGGTLWSNLPGSSTITSKTLSTGAAGASFTTPNGCVPSELQAVGRWVYWECRDGSWVRGAGISDRQTGRTTTAPEGPGLLGDGYFVGYTEKDGLTVYDLHSGLPASGAYADLPRRVLVNAADLGDSTVRRSGWTVDRFGGHVAYTGQDRRVRIVPTGIAASPLSVIDTRAPAASLDLRASAPRWTGTWWLSKPAASWRLTVKNKASGKVVRTVSGGEVRGSLTAAWDGKDTAGRLVGNGAYTWTLTAVPADGQGAALSVSNTVKVTGGAAVARDFTGDDGFGDLLAFTPAGVADFRAGTGTGTGRVDAKVSGAGWTGTSAVTAAVPFDDGDGDRCNDVLVRVKSGELRAYRPACGAALTPSTPYTKVGLGWNVYDTLTSPGDVTGDGRADLIARETTTGLLFLYESKGAGVFKARLQIGKGWKGYLLAGAGDLDGDGRPDLLARDTSGVLWRYPANGTGATTLGTRVKVGGGWQVYDALVGVGDISGDGRADLLARDTSGALWSYPGDGKGLFATRVKIGGGWLMYNRLA